MYPSGNPVFNCYNFKGVKLSTRLRISVTHLCPKFKHSSQDSFSPICSCVKDGETSALTFLIIQIKDQLS